MQISLAVKVLLEGRDIFAQFPTGFGKTITTAGIVAPCLRFLGAAAGSPYIVFIWTSGV